MNNNNNNLDKETQQKIAVQNLSKLKFFISPDGKGAVSETFQTYNQGAIIKASLQVLLGDPTKNKENGDFDKWQYTIPEQDAQYPTVPPGYVTEKAASIHSSEAVSKLAQAGVKDFAEALGVTTHAGRVK